MTFESEVMSLELKKNTTAYVTKCFLSKLSISKKKNWFHVPKFKKVKSDKSNSVLVILELTFFFHVSRVFATSHNYGDQNSMTS